MSRFYEHLVRGESASESLHQAMKWMRSNGFTKVSQWAPFVLIGDDVTFDFENKGTFISEKVFCYYVYLLSTCVREDMDYSSITAYLTVKYSDHSFILLTNSRSKDFNRLLLLTDLLMSCATIVSLPGLTGKRTKLNFLANGSKRQSGELTLSTNSATGGQRSVTNFWIPGICGN